MKHFQHPFFAPEDAGGDAAPKEPAEKPTDDGQPGKGADAGGHDPFHPEAKGMSFSEIFLPPKRERKEEDTDDEPDGEQPEKPDSQDGEPDGDDAQPPEALNLSEHKGKVKIGEQEYTLDDLQEAIRERDNKANWQAKLTQESQLMNWFQKQSPEVQDKFVAYGLQHVYGKAELPEDVEAKPFTLKTKDPELGEDIEISIEPGSEHWKALEAHFESLFKAKHRDAFTQLKNLQDQNESVLQEKRAFEERAGQQALVAFIKSQGFNLPTEGDVGKQLRDILLAGEAHPQYGDANRLFLLGQAAKAQGLSLEAAAEAVYGKQKTDAQKAAEQQERDRKKQDRFQPTKPRGKAAQSPDEAFLQNIAGRDKAKQHADLWKGKL